MYSSKLCIFLFTAVLVEDPVTVYNYIQSQILVKQSQAAWLTEVLAFLVYLNEYNVVVGSELLFMTSKLIIYSVHSLARRRKSPVMHSWSWSLVSLLTLVPLHVGEGLPCTHVPEEGVMQSDVNQLFMIPARSRATM